MGVQYATTNPAIAAFNEGMKAAGDRRAEDVRLLRNRLDYEENLQTAPSRIERSRNDTRISSVAADVAEATKGADISIKYNAADRGTIANQDSSIDLAEKRTTSPSRVGATIASNQATTEQAPLATEDRRTIVNERKQVSPYRVQQEKNQATIGGINATDSQLKFFKETVRLLEAGQTAEAEELARRTGETIPDAVKNDAGMRRVLAEAIKDAELRYPNRPAAQFDFIQKATERAKEVGIGNRKPEDRVATIPGAPAISQTGSKKNDPADLQIIDGLVARGIAKDAREAWNLHRTARTDPDKALQDLYRGERDARLKAAQGSMGMTVDNTKLSEIEREASAAAYRVRNQLRASNLAPPSDTGAPAPAAPPPPAAPAAPAAPATAAAKKPWFWESWFGSSGAAAADPAAEYSGAALSPSGAIDGRSLQTPTPKAQERVPTPGAAPAPSIEQLRERAKSFDPEAIRERARQRIASGDDRGAVLSRLRELGIDTSGL